MLQWVVRKNTDGKITCCVTNEYISLYIHSIALDRALASLTGFMVVGYVRCGVISPTINLVLAT
jgi:hypothetical protein